MRCLSTISELLGNFEISQLIRPSSISKKRICIYAPSIYSSWDAFLWYKFSNITGEVSIQNITAKNTLINSTITFTWGTFLRYQSYQANFGLNSSVSWEKISEKNPLKEILGKSRVKFSSILRENLWEKST